MNFMNNFSFYLCELITCWGVFGSFGSVRLNISLLHQRTASQLTAGICSPCVRRVLHFLPLSCDSCESLFDGRARGRRITTISLKASVSPVCRVHVLTRDHVSLGTRRCRYGNKQLAPLMKRLPRRPCWLCADGVKQRDAAAAPCGRTGMSTCHPLGAAGAAAAAAASRSETSPASAERSRPRLWGVVPLTPTLAPPSGSRGERPAGWASALVDPSRTCINETSSGRSQEFCRGSAFSEDQPTSWCWHPMHE